MKATYLITISALSLALGANAQDQRKDSTFSRKDIHIFQEYTPEVKLPPKQKIKPGDVHLETPNPEKFEYQVPAQALNYTYGAVSIKPLALQPFPAPISYQNYAALGIGNFSTIFADLGLTYHEEGRYDAYIHGNHFSQRGGRIADRQSSNTHIRAGGKYFLNQHILNGNVTFDRTGLTYYGYNPDFYIPDSKSDIRQVYTTLEVNAGLEKFNVDPRGIALQPQVGVYFLGTKTGESEFGLQFDAPFSYQLKEGLEAGVGISGLFTQLSGNFPIDNYNPSFLQFNPYVQYQNNSFFVHVGISPSTANEQGWALLPQLKARYVVGKRAALDAGWIGNVEVFSLKHLSEKNPFIFRPNTGNGFHHTVYGGVELALISNVKVEAKAQYHRFSQYAQFVNDYGDNSGHHFRVDYHLSDLGVFELYGAAHILLSNKFDLGARMSFYTYNQPVFHEPRVDFNGYMRVRPIKWLSVGTTLNALVGMDYKVSNSDLTKNLPAIFNLSANAQADITQRFSVFLNVDNLLNQRYQRWYRYEVYGFNIFGGLKYKF